MINFKCQCGKSYSVNDNLVGRTANCQQCGQKIIVPSASQPDESNSFTVPVPPIQQSEPAPPPPADLFCTNCGNMISEQAFACMSCGAKPTGHKKFCRQCGVALNPEQIVCIQCGAALAGGSFGKDSTTVANVMAAFQSKDVLLDTPQKKSIHFWTMLCLFSFVLFVTVSLLPSLTSAKIIKLSKTTGAYHEATGTRNLREAQRLEEQGELPWSRLVAFSIRILYYLTFLAYMFCYHVYLRKLWEEIPREFARTTPTKAAGFALIPIFHWYWLFTAFLGLYKDMNKAAESFRHDTRFTESLIQIVCVFWIYRSIVYFMIIIAMDMETETAIFITIALEVLNAIITISAYWIIRKNVLEFVDIKSSMEK